MNLTSYSIYSDRLPSHGQLLPRCLHSTSPIHHHAGSHTFLYLDRLVVTSKRDFFFFAKISQTKMVNGLIFFSELFNYAAFWVRGLAGRTTLSELQRALQMSLLCSVKLQRRKDGPLTTDSCQWDGTLALTRPMSSNGGDKCLANQLAYKITALPSAAHTSTQSDSMHSLQLSCSRSCVCVSLSLTHSPQCYLYRYKGSGQYNM